MKLSILTILVTVIVTVSSTGYADYRIGDRGARWVKTRPAGVKTVTYPNNPYFSTWQAER